MATKKKQRAEIAVLVCRFDAGHFATPGALVNVVKSPFVSAGCNYRHTAEAGAVLSIINSARALLFVLQISGLVRDLANGMLKMQLCAKTSTSRKSVIPIARVSRMLEGCW